MKSPLRDLAEKLQAAVINHPAYGQGSKPILNCIDHLCAMARIEEQNQTEQQKADDFKEKIDQSLNYLYNPFEPDNQSNTYKHLKAFRDSLAS